MIAETYGKIPLFIRIFYCSQCECYNHDHPLVRCMVRGGYNPVAWLTSWIFIFNQCSGYYPKREKKESEL